MSNVRDRGVIDITLEEDGRYVLVILDDMKRHVKSTAVFSRIRSMIILITSRADRPKRQSPDSDP